MIIIGMRDTAFRTPVHEIVWTPDDKIEKRRQNGKINKKKMGVWRSVTWLIFGRTRKVDFDDDSSFFCIVIHAFNHRVCRYAMLLRLCKAEIVDHKLSVSQTYLKINYFSINSSSIKKKKFIFFNKIIRIFIFFYFK